MSKSGLGAGVVAIVLAIGGCGGDGRADADAGLDPADAGMVDAGQGLAGDASPGLDAGEADAGAASDAGVGTGSVRWVTELEPREIDGDIALEYAFEYELAIDGDPFAFTLTLERCIQLAGMAESCDTGELSNLPGSSFVRFGVDPSMYAVGENHYTFHLMLDRGAERVDEATLDLELDVTSCESCVGSGATR